MLLIHYYHAAVVGKHQPLKYKLYVMSHILQGEALITNHKESNNNMFYLCSRALNIGQLNIQGICGENLNKFSELKVLLALTENNILHILG